jgi:hypothetical protein
VLPFKISARWLRQLVAVAQPETEEPQVRKVEIEVALSQALLNLKKAIAAGNGDYVIADTHSERRRISVGVKRRTELKKGEGLTYPI